jgi:hypothetical protein
MTLSFHHGHTNITHRAPDCIITRWRRILLGPRSSPSLKFTRLCALRVRRQSGYGVRRHLAAFPPADMSARSKSRSCPRSPKKSAIFGPFDTHAITEAGKGAWSGQNGNRAQQLQIREINPRTGNTSAATIPVLRVHGCASRRAEVPRRQNPPFRVPRSEFRVHSANATRCISIAVMSDRFQSCNREFHAWQGDRTRLACRCRRPADNSSRPFSRHIIPKAWPHELFGETPQTTRRRRMLPISHSESRRAAVPRRRNPRWAHSAHSLVLRPTPGKSG